jgi:hypothetical protein
VPQELESIGREQVADVLSGSGVMIVHAQYVTPVGDQPLAEMGPEKSGAAGNHDRLGDSVLHWGRYLC